MSTIIYWLILISEFFTGIWCLYRIIKYNNYLQKESYYKIENKILMGVRIITKKVIILIF